MVIGASELRRLGLVRKPAVVVPNHMLEQFTREWLQLYPQARVLAASSEDLAGERRRAFVARAAANDWDAVIMTRSAFERLPVSPETEAALRSAAARRSCARCSSAREGERRPDRQADREAWSLARRAAAPGAPRRAARPRASRFEQTGIDYLIVDEAHDYKNLQTVSNIRDAAIDGSKRATDLHMKLEYLRARHGARVATIATATPIANSITEAHVMSRYLRPDLLARRRRRGLRRVGGDVRADRHRDRDGPDRRRRLPDAHPLRPLSERPRDAAHVARVRRRQDRRGPRAARPRARRSAPTGSAPPRRVADRRQPRAHRLRRSSSATAPSRSAPGAVTPEEDNMLKITERRPQGRARHAPGHRPAGQRRAGKLDVAAEHDRPALARAPRPRLPRPRHRRALTDRRARCRSCSATSPHPAGAAGTPTTSSATQLADRGVPADQVRFIHEARNDAEKARLFAACRAGHVAVLVGSTREDGRRHQHPGPRAIALHHLDCPWRPADIDHFVARDVCLVRASP